MRTTIRFVMMILLVVLTTAQTVTAQVPPDIWRSFAERVAVGSELNVRLTDGRRFRATLIGVNDDAILLQPRTRVAVPVQAVAYEEIVRLERTKAGIGAGKAVAIGVATGVGAFFGTLALLIAASSD
jgi:hypothetical protein